MQRVRKEPVYRAPLGKECEKRGYFQRKSSVGVVVYGSRRFSLKHLITAEKQFPYPKKLARKQKLSKEKLLYKIKCVKSPFIALRSAKKER